MVKVAAALESEHGLDGQVGEVILLHIEKLGGQRGTGDVQQVLLEQRAVGGVVYGGL